MMKNHFNDLKCLVKPCALAKEVLKLFMVLLCGDIGASNSRLAVIKIENQNFTFRAKEYLKNSEYQNFDEVLLRFQRKFQFNLDGACFGIAGPVLNGHSEITNLHWQLNEVKLAELLNIERCFLINDLEAIAYGIPILDTSQRKILNIGSPIPGPQAVIAPGSGIGEAILFWNGKRHIPMPTEGGHTSFSPTSKLQFELLQYLSKDYSHVSWERVLSGPGLINIYNFLRQTSTLAEPKSIQSRAQDANVAALITAAANLEKNELCIKTIELFFEILATEAGNLALKCLPTAGLFIAGGITPKLMGLFDEKLFLKNFSNKGRMGALLEKIPVSLILNDEVGILGAAHFALNSNREKPT